MKRSIAIIAFTMMLSLLLCNHAIASGYITGQAVIKGDPIDMSGVKVSILNAVNAELVDTVYADPKGFFISAPLKEGVYKIHFSISNVKEKICVDTFYGQPDAHLGLFDLAGDIKVVDNMKTDLGTFFVPALGICQYLCELTDGRIIGYIYDSSTGYPLPSIQVKFKDPYNALPIFTELTTDANGAFYLVVEKHCGSLETKIRIYDPNGVYSPEYYGAGGVDSFTLGKVVEFTRLKVEIKEDLAKVPPAEQIVNIIEDIQASLTPQDAQSIVAPLQQAEGLLVDANPNNDKGACGILTGSANKMNGLVSSGRLTQAEADALTASIDALKIDLGCK